MAAHDGEPGPKLIRPPDGRRGATPSESSLRRLFLGLLSLVVIEFLIVPRFEDSENFLTIFPMELAGFMHAFASSNSVDYTFVDVDDVTFSNWRTSGHTNRQKIKELISRIASDKLNRPKAIVVDIDLSAPVTDKSGMGAESIPCPQDITHYRTEDESRTPEQILTFYVCEYAKNEYNPPLIFVQSLRRRSESSEQDPFEAIPLLFEKPKKNSSIYFATSGLLRSADAKVRSWLLAEPACDHRDQLKTISSVELLLLPVRLKDDPPEGRLHPDIVEDKVQNFYRGRNCRLVETPMPPEIQLGDQKIRLSSKHLRDRIVYTIKWRPREKNRLTGRAHYIEAGKLDQPRGIDVDDFFSGRVVVIGGSNEESRDIYDTPYGPMPGAVVLINAIDSLRVDYQIRELSYWAEKVVVLSIGFTVLIIFEILLRIERGLVVYLLGYVLGLVVSIALLYSGVWFGVSAVVFGGVAHLIAKSVFDIWDDIKERATL